MTKFVQLLIIGIATGSIYGLIALGFTVVYKATKVYEYYTSQSYAALGDLFLVRMVSSGSLNLESYVAELQNAFAQFEEQYLVPLEADIKAASGAMESIGRTIGRARRDCE